jgi:hypothetical protein
MILQLSTEFDVDALWALTQNMYKAIIDGVWSLGSPSVNVSWGLREATISSWTPINGYSSAGAFDTIMPA